MHKPERNALVYDFPVLFKYPIRNFTSHVWLPDYLAFAKASWHQSGPFSCRGRPFVDTHISIHTHTCTSSHESFYPTWWILISRGSRATFFPSPYRRQFFKRGGIFVFHVKNVTSKSSGKACRAAAELLTVESLWPTKWYLLSEETLHR